MNWVYVVGGLVFVGIGIVGCVGALVSERRRRELEAMGSTPWLALVPAVVGVLFVVGGSADDRSWVAVLGFAALIGFGLWSRRRMARLDDPPPMAKHLGQTSMNPLVTLRHPIRTARAQSELFKVRRNKAEHEAWRKRRGLG